MGIFEKLKVFFNINSAYENISGIVKGGHMSIGEMLKSKTIWGIVISTATSILHIVNPTILGTPIATSIITIATALGIYGRIDANQPQ